MQDCSEFLKLSESMEISGRVTRLTGLVMEAVGIKLQ
jgi:flagellum-specific ATP synthase